VIVQQVFIVCYFMFFAAYIMGTCCGSWCKKFQLPSSWQKYWC